MFLGLRMITTTFVYDDPDRPDRPTGTIPSPPWANEDVALLLALDAYDSSLCACGEPRSTAWHSEMDGWWESQTFVCHACTAKRDDGQNVVYAIPVDTYPADRKGPLPPFRIGVTTTPDDKHAHQPAGPPVDASMA